jgi:ribosomal protein L32E
MTKIALVFKKNADFRRQTGKKLAKTGENWRKLAKISENWRKSSTRMGENHRNIAKIIITLTPNPILLVVL